MWEFRELIQTCQFKDVRDKLAAVIRLAKYQHKQLELVRWGNGKSTLVIHFEDDTNKGYGDMLFVIVPLYGLSFRSMHWPPDELKLIPYRDRSVK